MALPGTRNPPLYLAIALNQRGRDRYLGPPVPARRRPHLCVLALSEAPDGAGGRENPCPPVQTTNRQHLIGASEVMTRLRHEISRMAATAFTVLVEGESGSGKELVARRIHDESDRRVPAVLSG